MARRKRQSSPQPSKAKASLPKSFGLYLSIAITLVLGGIPFAMGKYIELNSPGPFDSGAFVYSAEHLLQGATLGVDEQSSARPSTLLANIIGVKLFGFNDVGPKIIQMTLQLSALFFMFYALRKVFGSVAASIGTVVAAIYLSAPLIAKFGNVKEQFMIPFMIAAACSFLLYGVSQKRCWLIATGFFALQPYYFKPTGFSILIALAFFLFLKNVFSGSWKTLASELGLFFAGYAFGLLVPGSLYIWQKQPVAILNTLPAILLKAGFIAAVIIAGIIFIFAKRMHPLNQLRQVSKWIWISGLCLAFIALAIGIYMIKKEPGSYKSDVTSYLQSVPFVRIPTLLYETANKQVDKILASSGLRGGYVSDSWKAAKFSTLATRIFRYYKALSVPILLAIGSVITAGCVWLPKLIKKNIPSDIQSKFVWALGFWWILDMLFVWGSPRSYEQYYLPLCASGAMLSGFVIWKWQQKLLVSSNKMPWLAAGAVVVITLGCLTVPIFIGQRYSPDTGSDYVKNPRYGERQRGFLPALKELDSRKKNAWIAAGDFIRTHSTPEDKIYVWGWYPGIYVKAQRLAPVPEAFEGDMHVKSPYRLGQDIDNLVRKLKEQPPKFIVDTRKQHYPNDRLPLELWPIVPQKMFGNDNPRLLSNKPQEIATFDSWYSNELKNRIDEQEALRYQEMKPFRDFVMNNYRVVSQYGIHILFERK